jgi:hypothetical protein
MNKVWILALAFALPMAPGPDRPAPLKEEAITIEYNATRGEAALTLEAESEESLERVSVQSPYGAPVLALGSLSAPFALSGFKLESQEGSLASVLAMYPEGTYDIRARTVEGRPARGKAQLRHHLPPAPAIAYPLEGSVGIPSQQLTVSWVAGEDVDGFRVTLEQDENDGLTVVLPRDASSLRVPEGVLAPHAQTHLEVGAIHRNGNCTMVEVFFETD